MRWPELVVLAVIVVAVVVRGWPRRRNDRWTFSVKVERDRSDSPDAPHRSQSDEDDPGAPDMPTER